MEITESKLGNCKNAYTFDELLMLPGYAQMSPKDIDSSSLLDGITLNSPFLSAAMDTVTGPEMAIALGLSGGLGVIHRNCSTEEALEMLRKVKSFKIPGSNVHATKDKKSRLAVGAAISSEVERAITIAEEADILFTDVASFHNQKIFEAVKKIIKSTGKKIVIGNLGTEQGVLHAIKEIGSENISGIKVGMGGGSICTTTDVTGVGSPVPFALEEATSALRKMKLSIPIIADGGIRRPRDIAISFGLGASFVMLGNMLARCDESPGQKIEKDGKQYKVYWGMGSREARAKRAALDRYQDSGKDIAEGIKIYVEAEGPVSDMVDRLTSTLKTSMGYVGARNISEMGTKANFAVIRPKEEKKGVE